jgi:hypothetical protein
VAVEKGRHLSRFHGFHDDSGGEAHSADEAGYPRM